MKHINIGRFNERVLVQQPISQPDNAGGFIVAWQNFRTVWGFIKQHNSFEKIAGDANRLHLKQTLIIRNQSGLNATMRCVISGKTYGIAAMHPQLEMPQGWLRLELELMEGI
jgi:SPP1 family predicted phage head-tail adaptor